MKIHNKVALMAFIRRESMRCTDPPWGMRAALQLAKTDIGAMITVRSVVGKLPGLFATLQRKSTVLLSATVVWGNPSLGNAGILPNEKE